MSVVPFALDDFEMTPFTASSAKKRQVYRTGDGPAVVIIHEVPGITPAVAAFARRAREGVNASLTRPTDRSQLVSPAASLGRSVTGGELTGEARRFLRS
jgi:hypothetical protein